MTPLRQRMIEDMQIRNLSPHTQTSYLQQISQFARHFGKSPTDLCPEDIHTYQVYLINERKLSPSSVLIAVSAIRFMYKVYPDSLSTRKGSCQATVNGFLFWHDSWRLPDQR